MPVSQDQVLDALREVVDPDLHRNIVDLGFVKNVQIASDDVEFTIELTTPACPVRDQMKTQAEAAVAALPGVTTARATMTASVRSRPTLGGQALPGVRNIVAVGAGKGGVGKTTAAVNIAVALAADGARVGLMDGDVYGPNVPQMLGLDQQPGLTDDGKLVPPEAHGVKIVSMGMLVPPDQALIWRGPMLHSAVQQFLRDVVWGDLDYLVVDLPPGTGDVSLSMAQSVPVSGAVLVTTPQGISVSDVRKAVMMFRKLDVPVLGVIENMSHFVCGHCGERTEIFGRGGGRTMAEEMGIPFLGDVPMETTVRSGGDEGRPIALAEGDSPAARAFRDAARQVAAQISIQAVRSLKVVEAS
jgi:ATP-binding protein involved in chromosome partitioning